MNGGENQNDLEIRVKTKVIDNDFCIDLEKRRLEIISDIVFRIYKEKMYEL